MELVFEKVYSQGARSLQKQKVVSLERACMLLAITRQAIYQRALELAPFKGMVREVRRFMPRLGGRKLYFLLKPKLIKLGVKLGRNGFFSYLKNENLLVKPKHS